MKKIISMMLTAICMMTVSACGNANGAELSSKEGMSTMNTASLSSGASSFTHVPEGIPDRAENKNEAAGSKTLVAYFSAAGTTRPLAEHAAEVLEADIYEIVPEHPYTEADLAYYTDGRADREQSDPSARPAVSGSTIDISQYDVIVLGYPIWHGQAPKIISTFLESYDFTGKTIVPFCTSHSSGIGSSDTNLRALAANAEWLSGKRFAGDASKDEIEEWIRGLDLPKTAAAVAAAPRTFDFETKTVTLNSGYQMPVYGLGTYSLHDEVCVNSVTAALNSGVRLIDTAHAYGNEAEIGEAIRNSGIPREEIFVITKLYPDQFSDPEAAIDEALQKLDIGYIDMLLLHHPGAGDVAAYKAMEQAVADMQAFLERAAVVCDMNPGLLTHKVGAAVAAARRGGALQAIDTMNHFFLNHEMYVVGSTYWNMVYGQMPGDVEKDQEGMENMVNLGCNMAKLLRVLSNCL